VSDAGTGLFGTYFEKDDLSGSVHNQIDATIDFDWGKSAPTIDPAIGSDNFSVRWSGYLRPQYSEVYTFYARTDDGVRLWVNGQQIIDAWDTTGLENSGTISLGGNVLYDIKMEYKEATDNAYAELRYQSPSTTKQIIPSSRFFSTKMTIANGLHNLVVYENVICATKSTTYGMALTIATAGIASSFIIETRDEYSNARVNGHHNSFGSEYDVYTRVIPDDAATNLAARTVRDPNVAIAAGSANTGQHVITYTATRMGTHNLYSSVGIGQFPSAVYGLQATYYDEVSFTSPAVSQLDDNIDWSTSGSVGPGAVADDGIFSMRWSGLLKTTAAVSGEVTFSAYVSNGDKDERVRLWIDNVRVINEWTSLSGTQPSGTLATFSASQFYDLSMDYKATAGGGSRLALRWLNGATDEIIPSSQMFQAYTITGAPKRLRVNPAVACATTSTLLGMGLTLSTAGTQARFTITSTDAYNNVRGIGGDDFFARAFPQDLSTGMPHNPTIALGGSCTDCPAIVRADIADQGDSTYVATYTPTKRGAYALVESLLTQGGLQATYWDDLASPNAPISAGASGSAILTQDETNIDFSFASGAEPTGLTDEQYQARWIGAVRPSKASLYTFYASMNQKDERVKLWLDNSVVIDQWTSLSGTEASGTFSFGVVNGFYDIAVTYAQTAAPTVTSQFILKWENTASQVTNDDVAKAPVRSDRLYKRYDLADGVQHTGANTDMYVAPGSGCASQSTAYLMATSLSTAGVASTFTILGKDAYSNDRATNTDMAFQVDLYGSGGSPVLAASLTLGAANAVSAAYTTLEAKNYELFVKYNNDNAKNSPFTMTTRPNVICGSTSTAQGSGLTASAASSTSAFTVTARDAWSNAKTKNGEDMASGNNFVVRVVQVGSSGQGPQPERYDPNSGATTTPTGVDRAAQTIHATVGTLADDGKYPFTWTQSGSTSNSYYLHASWAHFGGLMATYYSKAAYTGTIWNMETEATTNRHSTRPAATVNFAHGAATSYTTFAGANVASCLGGNDGMFGIRWSGFVKPTQATEYTYYADVASKYERVKLWVDNALLSMQWTSLAATLVSGTILIPTADDYYDVFIEYAVDGTANSVAGLDFAHQCCAGAKSTVPSSALFTREDISGSPWSVTTS